MAQQQELPDVATEQAIKSLRFILPAGCYVLFTPHDGMFVSPDPADIQRSIDVLTSHK
jgi:hypothetical protein